MKDLSKEILAYALQNAIEFGKADSGRILPKLFQHGLKKEEIKEVMPVIQEAVKHVNSISEEERREQFEKLSGKVKKREEKEKELQELPNAGKKMIFRLAPFPSGALHIGNAKTYVLNALYAEKYGGKIILVMDDTIGSAEKPIEKDSYDLIEDAFKFLKVKYDKPIVYKSDRLEIYYEYAEKLLKKDAAYVCHCSAEELRANRAEGKECSCRQFPIDIQIGRWKEMFNAKEGHVVVRLKTDMQHPNPAFRDRVLFKISDREHPRVGKKYRVWPSLEMSWAIDDVKLGITHVIRGNELMMETEMEKFIWDIFGWKHPEVIHTGLVKLSGGIGKISKSKARKEVKSGEYSGWDDPRTWSIQSLKRRGISAESFREFVEEIGLNRQDITVPIDSLYAINRKKIDADADRYSFVQDAVEIDVKGAPVIGEIEVPVHPDKKKKKKINVGKIFIAKHDLERFAGKEIRLLHLYNVLLGEKSKMTSVVVKPIPKINWVSNGVSMRVLMPNGEWVSGLAEKNIEKLKKDEMIQFERFGFVRFDGVRKIEGENIYEFWFAHK